MRYELNPATGEAVEMEDEDFVDPGLGEQTYRIGKSTPWRRMTDAEAVKVEAAMASVPVRLRMIYDAASYLDTADELFGQLKAVIVGAGLTAERADELLALEDAP